MILAATHESFLDPPLVGCRLRPLYFLARDTLAHSDGRRSGPKTWALRALGVLEIDREAGSEGLRQSLEVLSRGAALVVFPEGTRSVGGEVGEFRAGVGLLALRSGAPVVPVLVDGARRIWPRDRRFPRLFAGPVRIVYGEPITFPRGTKARDAAARLRDLALDLRETPQEGRPA